MDRVKITITVPKQKEKWLVAYSINGKHGQPFKKETATLAYTLLERKLSSFLASPREVEINVIVNYSTLYTLGESDWKNEGEYNNKEDALYALGCFMEDHLNEGFYTSRLKQYKPEFFVDCD